MSINLATTPLERRHLPVVGTGAPQRRLRFFADQNAGGTPGAGDDAGGKSDDEAGKGGGKEFTPPASQEDLDKIIEARIARVRAQYPDYESVKDKAAKWDAAERDKKPAEQRVADDLTAAEKRAQEAEQRASEAEARALRATVAADKGVPLSLLTGTTKEEIEASADALIDFRGEKQDDSKQRGPRVQNAGRDRSNDGKSEQSVDAGRELYQERRSRGKQQQN